MNNFCDESLSLGELTLSMEQCFRHLVVFGSTGSGKTRYVLLPLLRQVLGLSPEDPDRRAGALIFDVKGDMPGHVERVMQLASRTDPILTIGRNGNAWFDPFADDRQDSRAAAERLIQFIQSQHSQRSRDSYDDFWGENNRRFLHVSVILSKMLGCGDMGGPLGIAAGVDLLATSSKGSDEFAGLESKIPGLLEDLDKARALGAVSEADHRIASCYLRGDAANLSRNTWSVIVNYAFAYISAITDSNVARLLRPSSTESIQFLPEAVFDQGRVVVVALSAVHFGHVAEVFRSAIKQVFQQRVLQRAHISHFDGQTVRLVNQTRPVLWVADEFPSCLTPGTGNQSDTFFLDKCRESRVACLLSAQGVSALHARLDCGNVNHLLNNCCTKVFMATDCPDTLEYFERCMPKREEDEESAVYAPRHAAPVFRFPNYQHVALNPWRLESKTITRRKRPIFEASDLRALATGESIVLQPRGLVNRIRLEPLS